MFGACNNTFNGAKFPLEYIIVATPSITPVPPNTSFTVSFDVTVVASAGFLNGVYTALGSSPAVPITEDKATIVPFAGATGAAVQAARTTGFTIPAPAATPVTVGVNIPLGTVTGTYTSDASGTPIAFALAGNAFAPAGVPAGAPADTLPAGVATPAWSGSGPALALTAAGAQTYTRASLAGGLVKPYLVCMAGAWTQGGTAAAPTFAQPYVPEASGGILIDNAVVGPTTTTLPGATTVPPATTVAGVPAKEIGRAHV